jgi:hypothetical protein
MNDPKREAALHAAGLTKEDSNGIEVWTKPAPPVDPKDVWPGHEMQLSEDEIRRGWALENLSGTWVKILRESRLLRFLTGED